MENIILTQPELTLLRNIKSRIVKFYIYLKNVIDEEGYVSKSIGEFEKDLNISNVSVMNYIETCYELGILSLYSVPTLKNIYRLNIPQTEEEALKMANGEIDNIPTNEEVAQVFLKFLDTLSPRKVKRAKIFIKQTLPDWHDSCSYISNYKSNYKSNISKMQKPYQDEEKKEFSKESLKKPSTSSLDSNDDSFSDSSSDEGLVFSSPGRDKVDLDILFDESSVVVKDFLEERARNRFHKYKFPQLTEGRRQLYLAFLVVAKKAWDKWVLNMIENLDEDKFKFLTVAMRYLNEHDELYYHYKDGEKESGWELIRSKEAVFKSLLKKTNGLWDCVGFSILRHGKLYRVL